MLGPKVVLGYSLQLFCFVQYAFQRLTFCTTIIQGVGMRRWSNNLLQSAPVVIFGTSLLYFQKQKCSFCFKRLYPPELGGMIVHKIGSRHKFHPMGCFDVRSWSQLQSVRTMDLISHHHLLGTMVIRDYDLLSHKYSLKHASLLAPYQLSCWALSGTRKHKSSSPLGSAHFMFLCASTANKVVLKRGIQKGRVVMLLSLVYAQPFVFNVATCFWAGACHWNVVLIT